MAKQKRIKLDPTKILGLKQLVGVKSEKTLIAQAMVGYKGVVGYKPPV